MKQRRMTAFGLVGYGSALIALHPQPGQWSRALRGDAWAWLREDPQRALVVACASIGWLLAAWLFTVTALAVVGGGAGATSRIARRLAEVITPAAMRAVLEVTLGAALAAAGPASAAIAGPIPTQSEVAAIQLQSAYEAALAPVPAPLVAPAQLPLPDLDRAGSPGVTHQPRVHAPPTPASPRPTPKPATPPTRTSPAVPAPQRHTVVAGDTLWSIAARSLPATASPSEVTRAWQRWYVANRAQVGADPALLLPGELLIAPQRAA